VGSTNRDENQEFDRPLRRKATCLEPAATRCFSLPGAPLTRDPQFLLHLLTWHAWTQPGHSDSVISAHFLRRTLTTDPMDGLATHGERLLQPHTQLRVSVAVKKGAIMAAMAAKMGPPFSWSLSLLTGGLLPERPGAVKGAPLLDAAKRTLDGEDRSATIRKEGKAPDSGREVDPKKWPLRSPPLTLQEKSISRRVVAFSMPAMPIRSASALRRQDFTTWCLDCGERTRVDSRAPMAVVFTVAVGRGR
jgi:hypothetical protein